MQIDLFLQIKIDSIVFSGKQLNYTRDSNAVFVEFGTKVKKDNLDKLIVYFSGVRSWLKRHRGMEVLYGKRIAREMIG
jgi:hypothetical protein